MRTRLIALLAASCSSMAIAGERGWIVSEASGPVQVSHSGISKVATRGLSVSAGDAVSTGKGGRAVLVRGAEYMMVAPNSRIALPQDAEASGITRIVQDFGSIVFMVKKKLTPHFEVKTPYLAAVVKGTTFSVGVTELGSSVQVLEGAVDVATPDGGAHDLLKPGGIARVGAGDLGRMEIEAGGIRRTITSPASAGKMPVARVLTATITPADEAAVESPLPVTATVYEAPVFLAGVTGGLVSGNVGGGELKQLAFASMVANEAAVSAVKTVEEATVTLALSQATQATAQESARQEAAAMAAATAKTEADRVAAEAAEAAARSEAATKTATDELAATQAAAAKAAAEAQALAQKAADAATATQQAQSDKAASEAAQAALEAAAQKAVQDAQKAAADAQKAKADQAARVADEAASKARNDAAKAAAELAKQQDKAAKDAQKAAADAAKAAEDAQKAKQKEPNGIGMGVLDLIKAVTETVKNGGPSKG